MARWTFSANCALPSLPDPTLRDTFCVASELRFRFESKSIIFNKNTWTRWRLAVILSEFRNEHLFHVKMRCGGSRSARPVLIRAGSWPFSTRVLVCRVARYLFHKRCFLSYHDYRVRQEPCGPAGVTESGLSSSLVRAIAAKRWQWQIVRHPGVVKVVRELFECCSRTWSRDRRRSSPPRGGAIWEKACRSAITRQIIACASGTTELGRIANRCNAERWEILSRAQPPLSCHYFYRPVC